MKVSFKVSFIDTNQNIESYLPAIIADALFHQMKREESKPNEVKSTTYQTKSDENATNALADIVARNVELSI